MARDFTGASTDRVQYGNQGNAGDDDFTVAMWLFLDTENGRIFDFDDSSNNSIFWITQQGFNRLQAHLKNDTSVTTRQTAINSYPEDEWFHLAVTHTNSTSSSNIHIFVNGTETAYSAASSSGTTVDNQDGNWTFGNQGTVSTNNMDGFMQEVGAWQRVLTDDEIQTLADGWAPIHIRPDLLFYSPFRGLPGETNYVSGDQAAITGTAVVQGPPGIIDFFQPSIPAEGQNGMGSKRSVGFFFG